MQWFQRRLGLDVSISVATSYDDLRAAIEQRKVDLAWAPPFVCAAVHPASLAVLKAVRSHSSSYHAALVVQERGPRTLDGLRDARVAWVDRLSTAGYLLPVAHLREHGHHPEDLFAEEVFTGSYGRALAAVLEGQADLASIYVAHPTIEAVELSLRELVGESSGRLRALDFTAASPNDGLVVVDRGSGSNAQQVLEQIRDLTDGRTHTLLLTVLDADSLELAKPGEYDALRSRE